MGINISLLFANYINWKHPDNPPVNDVVYHLVEFWATFGFALVECIALANTPKSLYDITNNSGDQNPLLLRMVMFLNIVATAVPALLVSFNIETFEILSHEIEYINELTMSFIDVVLLVSLWNSSKDKNNNNHNSKTTVLSATTTTGIAFLVAIVQLGVYNLMGYDTETHDMVGETLGHYLEFGFEIISSLILFWFCMDNVFIADKEIGLILYGRNHDEDCQICLDKSNEFVLTHENKNERQSQPFNRSLGGIVATDDSCVTCPTNIQLNASSQQQQQPSIEDHFYQIV
eukprot:14331203-Ditylum_brightwellii.AAC.1